MFMAIVVYFSLSAGGDVMQHTLTPDKRYQTREECVLDNASLASLQIALSNTNYTGFTVFCERVDEA